MDWIKCTNIYPPRERNILVCDDLGWVFVGSHERNYFKPSIPPADFIYTKEQEKSYFDKMTQTYRDALNQLLFRAVTFDCCQSEAVYWMELPPSPYVDKTLWTHKEDREPDSDDQILMYHEKIGVIEGFHLRYSDTFDCKKWWDEKDLIYWMVAPDEPA